MDNRWIRSLNGMGTGLLATLVVGTILQQIATLFGWQTLHEIGGFAQVLMAAAIGFGVAHALEAKPLVIFPTLVTATIGAGAIQMIEGQRIMGIGEPAGAYVAAVVTVLVGSRVIGKTKVDVLVVPMVCLVIGGMAALFISPTLAQLTGAIGHFINQATEFRPFYMGAVVAAIFCLVILSPLSSAALAITLGLDGLAAGAAVAGCASSMVGFAVISFKDNGMGGLISQGIGTSKIQFPNAVKNPYIIIPTLMASAVSGILSTTVFQLQSNSLGAGMGTSGGVGQIQTLAVMGTEAIPGILIVHFFVPALVSFGFATWLVRKGRIRPLDMKLTLN